MLALAQPPSWSNTSYCVCDHLFNTFLGNLHIWRPGHPPSATWGWSCHNDTGPTWVSYMLKIDTFVYGLYLYSNFIQFSDKYYSAAVHGAGNYIKHSPVAPYLLMVLQFCLSLIPNFLQMSKRIRAIFGTSYTKK